MKNLLLFLTLLLLSLTSAHGQISPEPKSYRVTLGGVKSTTTLVAKKSPFGDQTYCTSGEAPPQGIPYRIDINSGIDKDGLRYHNGSITVVVFENGTIIGNVQYSIRESKINTYEMDLVKGELKEKSAPKEHWELLKKFTSFNKVTLIPEGEQ